MTSHSAFSRAAGVACALALSGLLGTQATASVPDTSTTFTTSAETTASERVSDIYSAAGPEEVTSLAVPGFQLFFPTNLGGDGIRHPLVTFGNGSFATFEEYDALLHHLASWGFVVAVADSSVTGDGTEIAAAAQYLVDRNTDPQSIFHDSLDTEHVASVGHSQGAGGAINAATQSSLITSTAALDLPDPLWASRPVDVVDVTRLTGPMFFMTGADDPVSTASAQARYFDSTPVSAVRGRLLGVGHNWASDGEGFRGYLTAWLMYTLRSDSVAAGAFVGESPQLLTDEHWDGVAIKDARGGTG
ncbi:pimeloyl-ACP methyl ester carboxylesterase [Rhodococcus sp. 27YEA15]|uniref:poly(ethylene terephthalate) hydrolase family protein n=1 Tax=Rhodococcus sp. 27YEA15 TaxID=3156259 RepID=UPI003C7B0D47